MIHGLQYKGKIKTKIKMNDDVTEGARQRKKKVLLDTQIKDMYNEGLAIIRLNHKEGKGRNLR